VRVYRVHDAAAKTQSALVPSALPLPDKPSIAVLPFANMSGDPEQEYFADGMVEEIITALSRIRWLFVIARNSTFTYKGRSVDVKQVGRELGVRYVLEGSVRKAGQRVRITGQLIEALTGTHLWADRFDGSLEDIFELQDKVAISVAGVIEPTLQAAEIRRSADRPTSDLTAYDLYLRALANFPWFGREQMAKALDLFEQAIAHDPDFAPALAWAAVCHTRRRLDGHAEDPEIAHRKAASLAERALALAGVIQVFSLMSPWCSETTKAQKSAALLRSSIGPSPLIPVPPALGSLAAFSACWQANATRRSSIWKRRFDSARAIPSGFHCMSSVRPIFSAAASGRRLKSSPFRYEHMLAGHCLTALSRPATRIWEGWTTPALSLNNSVLSAP
jgi:TolB-like protein